MSSAANYLTKSSIKTNGVDPDMGLIWVYTLFAEEASTSKSFQQIAKQTAFVVIIGALWAN